MIREKLTRYRNCRVLVVEDDPIHREIVELLLADVGIVPRMAENGQEALYILSLCGPDAFDLVLMDIQMPLMDGLSAVRMLRSRAEFALLPIISMTAQTAEHEGMGVAHSGFNDHIGKPYDSATLYRMLAKWIPASKHQPLRDGVAVDELLVGLKRSIQKANIEVTRVLGKSCAQ